MSPFLLVLVLALLQGLTEYLPVSSSAHLVFGKEFLPGGEQLSANASLEVLLHVGTLLAVLLYYRQRIGRLLLGLFGRGHEVAAQRRLLGLLVLATLPAVGAGLLLSAHLDPLFGSPYPAAVSLLVTGLILWRSKGMGNQGLEVENLTAKTALLIGVVQACAIMPGISRSGSTIVAGMALGLSGEAAAAFSFLMSIPAVAGAAVLKLPELQETEALPFSSLACAVGVSFVVGWLALGLLVWITRRGRLHMFAPYCWLLGGLALLSALL